jgi:hypothetical protein
MNSPLTAAETPVAFKLIQTRGIWFSVYHRTHGQSAVNMLQVTPPTRTSSVVVSLLNYFLSIIFELGFAFLYN